MGIIIHFFKWLFITLIGLVVLFIAAIFIIRTIKADQYKIKTDNGIEESLFIELGGIKQHINIRGEDINNPIIIFLHGGPASPMGFVSYHYQPQLESEYTFVNWDQRGCGRTYYANPNMDMKTELSTDILLNDLDDLTDYLIDRFGQEKVIIMGHSWGTLLGSKYVKAHPEKVSAYIGVGQVINGKDNLIIAANKTLEYITKEGNEEDLQKLNIELNKFKNTTTINELDWQNYVEIVKLRDKYLKFDGVMPPLQLMWLGISSPYFLTDDLRWFLGLNELDKYFTQQATLLGDMFYTFNINNEITEYDVPVYYISGEHDWVTPTVSVEAYYQKAIAPDKAIIIIENTGHSPFMDDPDAFTKAVKDVLARSLE